MLTNKEKYEQAKKLIAQGQKITEACTEVGIKHPTYAYYKTLENKGLEKKPRKPYTKRATKYTALPFEALATKSTGSFRIEGSPFEIAQFIKALGTKTEGTQV